MARGSGKRGTGVWGVIGLALLFGGCAAPLEDEASSGSGAASLADGDDVSAVGGAVEGVSARPAVEFTEAPWEFLGTEGVIYETSHFRAHTTAVGSAAADRLPAFLEDSLAAYRSRFGALPGPSRPMETYLLRNRAEWQVLTQHLLGDRAEAFLNVRRGGFASGGRAVLHNSGLRQTMRLVGHEGWHQYTQQTFADSLPVWLEEGLATQFEGFRWDERATPLRAEFLPWANVERFDALREAEQGGELMPLLRLITTTPQEQVERSDEAAIRYYAQLWAFVRFLEEGQGGRLAGSLRLVLRDAATGRLETTIRRDMGLTRRQARQPGLRGQATFAVYFDRDTSAVGRAFHAYVRDITRPGARNAVVEGISPEGLSGS